ncbi:unnamed protein product [Citrullus colocynthis]|uniref:Uncharacterized protein n=1 Tax=Citrullus colocynthis TaxID=252529 RepID=A0ABP0Y8W0_9ROSI
MMGMTMEGIPAMMGMTMEGIPVMVVMTMEGILGMVVMTMEEIFAIRGMTMEGLPTIKTSKCLKLNGRAKGMTMEMKVEEPPIAPPEVEEIPVVPPEMEELLATPLTIEDSGVVGPVESYTRVVGLIGEEQSVFSMKGYFDGSAIDE